MTTSTLRLACRNCLVRAAPPSALATAAAAAGALWSQSLTPWLHLAAFVPAAACCIAAIEFWPTFVRGRPGADFVRRATPTPLHGCGATAAGALLALLVLLVPMALLAAAALPPPQAHRALVDDGQVLLDLHHGELTFAAPGAATSELRLRPVALLPTESPQPTALQVLADGEPLAPEPFEIFATRQLVRIPTGGRVLHTVTIRRVSGNLPLLFPRDGSLIAVDQVPRSRVLGSLLAFAVWLLPAGTALAIALLVGPFVSLPVGMVVGAAALLLQTLGQLGPAAPALTLCARGHWLPSEPLFRDCLPSLGTAIVVMICAMAVRAGSSR